MGHNINITKTKYIVISKSPPFKIKRMKYGNAIIDEFNHLGRWLNDKWDVYLKNPSSNKDCM